MLQFLLPLGQDRILKTGYYSAHSRGLKLELASVADRDRLRELHKKQPWRHFVVLGRQTLLLAAGAVGIFLMQGSWVWIVFAVVLGFTVFNFTVMLHEVLHGLVFQSSSASLSRFLELLYALPTGISPSQFTRWHLDHHAELGSDEGDPKRHHLSPRINKPWYKLLYFTPALFPIYFRAAARETATYPRDLRKRIAAERIAAILLHLTVVCAVAYWGGWNLLLKAYVVPVFGVFPIAFALNRLGQHYDINPDDPAQWSTLMKPNPFWDFAYLWSNYHLEHHYYPGVPFYNLPGLRRVLEPYFRSKGMKEKSYGQLLYGYLVLNQKPHTNWSARKVSVPVSRETY
jgi:fatty acid desaturase